MDNYQKKYFSENQKVGCRQVSVTSDEEYIYVVEVDTRTGDYNCIRYTKDGFRQIPWK